MALQDTVQRYVCFPVLETANGCCVAESRAGKKLFFFAVAAGVAAGHGPQVAEAAGRGPKPKKRWVGATP